MPLEQKQRDKIGAALGNMLLLLNAFKFVIKMPGTEHWSHAALKNIEDIIPDERIGLTPEGKQKPIPGRKQVFYDEHKRLAPDLQQKGFFAHYIVPSSLYYKPANYEEPLRIVSEWIKEWEKKLVFQEANPFGNILRDNSHVALRAMSDIQFRLVIDGGKNSLRKLDINKAEDIAYAEYKSVKMRYINMHEKDMAKTAEEKGQTLPEYLKANSRKIKKEAIEAAVECYVEKHREVIEIAARDKKKSVREYIKNHYDELKRAAAHEFVDPALVGKYIEIHNNEEYLTRKNWEVNRRKDVLQLLVAEIGDNIKTIKEIVQERNRNIDGTQSAISP